LGAAAAEAVGVARATITVTLRQVALAPADKAITAAAMVRLAVTAAVVAVVAVRVVSARTV
jgi:hypothetical protein